MQLWVEGMELAPEEHLMVGDIISDTVQGLLPEDLIEVPFGWGSKEVLGPVRFASDDRNGLAAQLRPLEVQLFVWAHGMKSSPFARFLDPNTDFSMPRMPELKDGAMSIADMRALDRRERGTGSGRRRSA